ncbi:MAG: aminomethyl-transferring glycine dehydrogenase subunit GcvPA [Solobacterium sp.]|nr:aminomethyl-transferring glycine dehydrogenase subunit GcvPA [Solobacterium sp.]
MGSYVPSTLKQREEMLREAGFSSMEDLYRDIPDELKRKEPLDLPDGKSELETDRILRSLAMENKEYLSVFRGAGAYRHYIPAIVQSVVNKEEFVTAYTPYQAEISQGVLQSIFEYQTMICELTGMDVSNASVYDGAVAAAEAVSMCRTPKKKKVYISAGVHPDTLKVVRTYCWAAQDEVVVLPLKDGKTDLSGVDGEGASCLILQQPNYFGIIEDAKAAGECAHAAGLTYVLSMDPFAMCLLPSPAEYGADIAIGEGQPLGMPLSFGGPYLGFMAATSKMMRKLPGRIVGETTDADGNKAYVLTLQAREQHIRREKASSNICSNEALCAMTASVYLAAMGPEGMREAARQCYSKSHYLAQEFERIGLKRAYDADFFQEFVTVCDDPEAMLAKLDAKGILGGQPVEGGILWCATEANTKEEIDALVKEVSA